MISIHSLDKTYQGNIRALRELSLEIPGAGLFGLLGVNGAGKTTLMRILAGLLDPTAGRVQVFGHDVTVESGRRTVQAMLGYLPQELGVYPDLTAREFLDYVAVLKRISSRQDREREIGRALDLVRLTDEADRMLKTYSGGMRQRVGIAQALLGEPRLMIVDEPTAGLDPEERVRFRNLLAEIAQRCAVILSTHIVEDIGQSCSDMAVLWQGGVLFRGTPGQLVDQARGRVWTILSGDGGRPGEGLVVVSTRQVGGDVEYRVLGEPGSHCGAVTAEPRLEDGYLWLMSRARTADQGDIR